MATRFSATATAATIGLVGGVLGASSAAVAVTSAASAPAPARPIPFSVAYPGPQQRTLVPAASVAGTSATSTADPAAPSAPAAKPAPEHATPRNAHKAENAQNAQRPQAKAKLPFHMTGKKARSLPDTGVPMSAALGAVTALTALLAGIGTVLAARRRSDLEV